MATNKTKNFGKALVNATVSTINTAVENGEKWQELTKKLVKKSEPVRKKQMDMVYETATAIKEQVNSGKERVLDLVGYEDDMLEKAFEYASKTQVGKKLIDVSGRLKEKVVENPMLKSVEKTTEEFKAKSEEFKAKSTAKLNDLKIDVLEQAKKILNKGEEIVEDVLEANGITKKVNKNVVKAKNTVKSTAQAATKKVNEQAKKVVADTSDFVKNDLKLINGIGPKLEQIFNENGIETFAQLAKASEEQIKAILEKAGPIFKNANFSDWTKQAENMAKTKTDLKKRNLN